MKSVKSVNIRNHKAVELINRLATELGITASAAATISIIQSLGNSKLRDHTNFREEIIEKSKV